MPVCDWIESTRQQRKESMSLAREDAEEDSRAGTAPVCASFTGRSQGRGWARLLRNVAARANSASLCTFSGKRCELSKLARHLLGSPPCPGGMVRRRAWGADATVWRGDETMMRAHDLMTMLPANRG